MSSKVDGAKGCSCEHHLDETTDWTASPVHCRSFRAGVCPVAFDFARMALSPLSGFPTCNSANSRARKRSPGVFCALLIGKPLGERNLRCDGGSEALVE